MAKLANAAAADFTKSYDGFEQLDITEETIQPDGSTVVEVKFNRKTYKVVYDKNAGTQTVNGTWPTDSNAYRYEANITLPNVTETSLTRTGYTFAGWTTVQNATDSDTVYNYGGTSPTMNPSGFTAGSTMTLYAKWTEQKQNTGIEVGFGIDTTTISVTEPTGSETEFSVSNDYSCVWKVDGEQKSTTNSLDMDTIATVPGVYDITLTATKDGKEYTWTGQYIKS